MKFHDVANLFEKLEKTSKRLEKILILRDFIKENRKESGKILDMIAGNYQREINKKTIGISLKTLFSVISFVSRKNESIIEKEFNRVGDIGLVGEHFLMGDKQKNLKEKGLNVEDIYNAFNKISSKTGTNSNKVKKEILSQLFLFAKFSNEYKYLARLLLGDLRIGVSEGVIREACVNSYFPSILDINIKCSKCSYINLNLKNCLNCSEDLDFKNQKEIIGPKNIMKIKVEDIKNNLNEKSFIETDNNRELYNLLLDNFEKKYNLVVSFSKVLEDLDKDLKNLFNAKIIIGTPIKSMLGVRAKNVDEAVSVTGLPTFSDYKYDGLRIQIHNNKGQVKLYSRNLDDVTKQFPEIVKFVKDNFSDLVFVMDSECVGFDFDKGKFLPFQLLSRRILSKNIDEVSHIKVVVKAFDIMLLGKDTIIDKSYKERREILESLFIGRPLKQSLSFDVERLKEIL